MSPRFVIAIMAGGMGKRLWPLSTPDRPKQFLPLFGGLSMLQKTFARAAAAVGAEGVFLVGNASHADIYKEQLPGLLEENLILEPTGRGTAAALALTASVCSKAAPGASIATVPADHIIPDPAAWIEAIRLGLTFAASNDRLVCLGVPARSGETKFGYMLAGETIGGTDDCPIKVVERFVEKPDSSVLDALISEGTCLRNMGTVAFRPDLLKAEMQRVLPEVLEPIAGAAGSSDRLVEAYRTVPVRSIDEAVLQQSERVAVVRAEIESVDAGDFVTLGHAVGRDQQGNASTGRVVAVDSKNNTVFAASVTVALVGVSDHIVVVEGDRILVCPVSETQRIKQIQENT